MKNARLFVALTFFGISALIACEAETGPDAPPRTNGCIDIECKSTPTAIPFDPDAGPPDGG